MSGVIEDVLAAALLPEATRVSWGAQAGESRGGVGEERRVRRRRGLERTDLSQIPLPVEA